MSRNKFEQMLMDEIEQISAVAEKLPGVVIIHDIRDGSILWMSTQGLMKLGLTAEEIKGMSAEEYHSRFFNSEDAKEYVPKIIELIERNNDEETITYFQQVRFSGDPEWHWHMSSTRMFMRDSDGKPLLVVTMSFPVDPRHHLTVKAGRLLEENNFLRKNLHLYATLSQREREVLRHLALGKSAPESANALFISLNTIETHRKNIKHELNTTSYYELCKYARAFDLI